MKKLLVLLVMMSLFGLSGVMAVNQDVIITPQGVVQFSVSPSLNFPAAIPGAQSVAVSTLTLGDTNTADLTVDVYLTEISDSIFTHVVLTTVEASITGLSSGPSLNKESVSKITIVVDDTDAELSQNVQNKVITATLTVPLGTLPTQKTGTITYSVTAPAPV